MGGHWHARRKRGTFRLVHGRYMLSAFAVHRVMALIERRVRVPGFVGTAR